MRNVPLAWVQQTLEVLERKPSEEFVESAYRQLDKKPPRLRSQEAKMEHLKRLLRERLGEKGGAPVTAVLPPIAGAADEKGGEPPQAVPPTAGTSKEGGMSGRRNKQEKQRRKIRSTTRREQMPRDDASRSTRGQKPEGTSSRPTSSRRTSTKSTANKAAKPASRPRQGAGTKPATVVYQNNFVVPALIVAVALVVGVTLYGVSSRTTTYVGLDANALRNGTLASGNSTGESTGDGGGALAGGSTSGATSTDPPCLLDKVATWSEIEGSGPQRLEVQGHTIAHVDFYPDRGVKSVSYIMPAITPPQTPQVWFGFGSMWQAPEGPSCDSFDWVADATAYAQARLDSGHSGLVVDMRSGTPQVVANVANMNQSDIDQLLALDAQAMTGPISGGSTTPSTGGSAAGGSTTPSSADCQNGVRGNDHNPVVGQTWQPGNAADFRIVNFWSNQPGVDQTQHKLLLKPGDNPGLLGGGSFWSWPSSCGDTVQKEFDKNPNPAVTLAELTNQGLVK